jgi:hypothetical protein
MAAIVLPKSTIEDPVGDMKRFMPWHPELNHPLWSPTVQSHMDELGDIFARIGGGLRPTVCLMCKITPSTGPSPHCAACDKTTAETMCARCGVKHPWIREELCYDCKTSTFPPCPPSPPLPGLPLARILADHCVSDVGPWIPPSARVASECAPERPHLRS